MSGHQTAFAPYKHQLESIAGKVEVLEAKRMEALLESPVDQNNIFASELTALDEKVQTMTDYLETSHNLEERLDKFQAHFTLLVEEVKR